MRKEGISFAPLTCLRRVVTRLLPHQDSPKSGAMKTYLGCIATLRSEIFDTCVVILPLPADPVEFDQNVIWDLAAVPTASGYIDMLFGNPDPTYTQGLPVEMSVRSTQDSGRYLYAANLFDNRVLFR